MNKKIKHLIEAVNDQSRVRGFTHRFYKYPAVFSPIFAESAIKSLSKKSDLILDPFMGGGTTIVEAIRADRKVIGVDLNPIAFFVTQVKISKLSKDNRNFIEDWAQKMSEEINYRHEKNHKFIEKAFSLMNYKGLGKIEISNLKKIIKGASYYLYKVKKIKNKRINNFLRLLLLRSMHSTLHDTRPISDFHIFKNKIRSNSLDMLEGMKSFDEYLLKSKSNFKIFNKCASKIHKIKYLKKSQIKLILTSPPYPNINVPYARWQIHGRRNTTLPYLILGYKIPENKSIFNFAHPGNKSMNIYFKTLKKIFSSIRKISNKKTILLQLVAFSNSDGVFERYLKTMEECGFKEIKIKSSGRVWRNVPNRSWQAKLKGDISASHEVMLMHKIK